MKNMDNEKEFPMLRHAPLESTTPLKNPRNPVNPDSKEY
jgi:hypothetical protein